MSATPQTMLKVVSSGLQDLMRLNPTPSEQPRTDPYRYVLKRRTRWASQWRYVPFDGKPDFGKTVTCTLPQDGELITRAVLVIRPPDLFTPQVPSIYPNWVWTNSLGHALCENISFSISSVIIDSVDSRIMEITDELETPVEHLTTKNQMLARDPSFFPLASADGIPCPPLNAAGLYPDYQTTNMTLHVVPPFWWNKGPGPTALPMQSLAKEIVQLTVTFRTIDQVVLPLYTFQDVPNGTVSMPNSPLYNKIGTPIGTMPPVEAWHLADAYWLVEYVSLETREGAAFRLADLQIPIVQHEAEPVRATDGAYKMRVKLDHGGLVRDITWAAQNSAAESYRAWFNFGRDLIGSGNSDLQNAILQWGPVLAENNSPLYASIEPYIRGMAALAEGSIWWPNAYIPDWNYSNGYYVPSSVDRYTDPFEQVTLLYKGKPRFELYGSSWTRSIEPALSCQRTPFIRRYVHRYNFGFWPTGGLAETLTAPADQVRGFANWDKIQNKDLSIWFAQGNCPEKQTTHVGSFVQYTAADTSGLFIDITNAFTSVNATDGLFSLTSRLPPNSGDVCSYVGGIINFTSVRAYPGFLRLILRAVPHGSTGIFIETATGYVAVCVAGASGYSVGGSGGSPGTAITCGGRGVDGALTHDATSDGTGGGGGGGRLGATGGVNGANGVPAPGASLLAGGAGIQMPLDNIAFMQGLSSTGGPGPAAGGDGWFGGGAGTVAGGGGGSYISSFITNSSYGNSLPATLICGIQPLQQITVPPPSLNLFIWYTRYNMLRVFGGRAAVMFDG